jgi:hypothetical protein
LVIVPAAMELKGHGKLVGAKVAPAQLARYRRRHRRAPRGGVGLAFWYVWETKRPGSAALDLDKFNINYQFGGANIMRDIVVLSFITLDGVMQAPGGPEEDPSGSFKYGGWTVPYFDEALGNVMAEQMTGPFALLRGRKTF